MSLFSFYRISKPSAEQVAPEKMESTYKTLRNKTFWGATVAYSLYYVCRMSLSVVKQPLIDEGILSAGELKITESEYALGISSEPEVNEVEVVSRLVNEKSATVLLISVPTTEVVSAVACVEQPLEVDLSYLSYCIVHDDLTELCVVRSITIVECYTKALACALDAVHDVLAL